jgi:NAD(P)H dehydrogenase (quinone)
MYHWGAIVAAPGYTDPLLFASGGNPYGTSVTVGQDGTMQENVEEAAKNQTKRTVQVAEMIKKGSK